MQVILLESLEGKGAAGEVIKVADGYARNYLLPRNIAIPATDSNMRTLEHRRAKIAERKAQDLEVAEAIKEKIDSQSITFEAKSGDAGRLFGSITSQDVADAIHEHFGVFIDKRKISDGTPIKTVGVHSVTIKIFSEVNAVMRILVGTPEEIAASEAAAKLAAEKAAARAEAEREAAARAEAEAAEAAAAADAESDAPDYEERFDAAEVAGASEEAVAEEEEAEIAGVAEEAVASEEEAEAAGEAEEAVAEVAEIAGEAEEAAAEVAEAADEAGETAAAVEAEADSSDSAAGVPADAPDSSEESTEE
jgi:large subunit ribosomal protein L9